MADVSYVDWVEFPHIHLRVEMGNDGGDVTRFVVQLEYHLENGWSPVVRFDHDPDAAMGHDITDEGLHMDVYRDGKKYDVVDSFPEVPLSVAPRYCIGYVEAHLDRLLRRFERWHDLNPGRNGGRER